MKSCGRGFWLTLFFVAALVATVTQSHAFCGFYLAKAEADLFNDASKVVIVRDGDTTTITMANDYRGELSEFAMVVPVPQVLARDQIRVRDPKLIDRIDAYTAPRLVEYEDLGNRCDQDLPAPLAEGHKNTEVNSLGVKVEAQYTVGEYDVLILSAEQSDGLRSWLMANGYKIPKDAEAPLAEYIAGGARFFVARVNLAAVERTPGSFLRPLQLSFRSAQFMLPIQLGMVNASGPQELFVFTITRKGRVKVTNYPTHNIPTDMGLPRFISEDFGAFYRAMFDRVITDNGMRAVYLEYAWDMAWCDPCAADPLSVKELRDLGAEWVMLEDQQSQQRDAFVTRLHIRYDKESFPEDLVFEETEGRESFQGRYIITRPADAKCIDPDDEAYRAELAARDQAQATNLARITNWSVISILEKMKMMQ